MSQQRRQRTNERIAYRLETGNLSVFGPAHTGAFAARHAAKTAHTVLDRAVEARRTHVATAHKFHFGQGARNIGVDAAGCSIGQFNESIGVGDDANRHLSEQKQGESTGAVNGRGERTML